MEASRMRRILQSLMVLVAVVALLPAMALSQVARGTPPFGSFGGGPDVINEANINVHWGFPITGKAGRGMGFDYTLGFDNSVWNPTSSTGQPVWTPANTTFGWTRQTEAVIGYVTYDATTPGCGTVYSNWVYHDPGGTAHSFSTLTIASTTGCGYPTAASAVADDGSGYKITAYNTPSATVVRP